MNFLSEDTGTLDADDNVASESLEEDETEWEPQIDSPAVSDLEADASR